MDHLQNSPAPSLAPTEAELHTEPWPEPRYAEEGGIVAHEFVTSFQVLVPTRRSVAGHSNQLQLRRYREPGGGAEHW